MKYRSIYKIIGAIKKEVPKNWRDRKNFILALDDVIDSANYRAPEAYGVNFDQLGIVLADHLGTPDEDFKQKIADIFAGKTEIKGMDYYEYP
jgi:hypothetical protein